MVDVEKRKDGYDKLLATEGNKRLLEAAVLNGLNDKEIASLFGMTEKGMEFNYKNSRELKQTYLAAKDRILTEQTDNLRKLANGFWEKDFQYQLPFGNYDEKQLKYSKDLLIEKLQNEEFDDFWMLITRCLDDADKISIKVTEKYYSPDHKSINKLLEAGAPDVWDKEAKNKQIPTTVIHVKVPEGDLKKIGRAVRPDYVVEDRGMLDSKD